MRTEEIRYRCDGVDLHGYAAHPEGSGKVGGVLVCHDWSGRNAMAERVARDLAGRGYAGFALDMYGGGRTGDTRDEKAALMEPLRRDRGLLMRRIGAAAEALRGLERVDPGRTAAIGFCFGGLCVLDLARAGDAVRGVVSFHGLLDPPPAELCRPIRAKVLVLHGHRDPMVPPERLVAFEREMDEAGVDWQVHAYGTAVHAFTNPDANDPEMGTVYDVIVARRAWAAMDDFLQEIL